MSKFQIGDRVVCVRNTPAVQEGWVGYVKELGMLVRPLDYMVESEDGNGTFAFYECELELLEHADCSKRIGALKDYPTEDKVNKPNHYQLKGDFEVKHLMELLLDRIEESDKVQFSHFQSSCYKEMMQYLLRCMLKNGYEDIYKARYYLNEVIRVHEERMQS